MEEMLKRDGITVKPGAKEILLWLKKPSDTLHDRNGNRS